MMIYRIISLLLSVFICSCSEARQNIITVFINQSPQGRYILGKDGLIDIIVFYGRNSNNDTLTYFYNNLDEVEKVIMQGKGNVIGFDEKFEMRNIQDVFFRDSSLRSMGIIFPLPFINSSELGDIATVFSVSDNYKTLDEKGGKTTILFENINERIRFNSFIEKYIPSSALIEKYKLTLDKGLPIEENVYFEDGVLERKYQYDKMNRLVSITYNCTYNDKSILTENKTFDYR